MLNFKIPQRSEKLKKIKQTIYQNLKHKKTGFSFFLSLLTYFRLIIFQSMSFVNDQNRPIYAAQRRLVDAYQFVRRQQNVKLYSVLGSQSVSFRTDFHRTFDERKFVFSYHLSTIFIADIGNHVKIRCPKFELSFPINYRRQRSAN